MALPTHYQQLADRLGVTKPVGQSDEVFIRWLDNLKKHISLVREAKGLGVSISFGMKSQELREAIKDHLCVLLKERGFVPQAKVKLGKRIIEIREIAVRAGRNPVVTVKYWIIEPWEKPNDRGRANHTDAQTMLKKGTLVK